MIAGGIVLGVGACAIAGAPGAWGAMLAAATLLVLALGYSLGRELGR